MITNREVALSVMILELFATLKTFAESSLNLGKTVQVQQNRLRDVVRLFSGGYFCSMCL